MILRVMRKSICCQWLFLAYGSHACVLSCEKRYREMEVSRQTRHGCSRKKVILVQHLLRTCALLCITFHGKVCTKVHSRVLGTCAFLGSALGGETAGGPSV